MANFKKDGESLRDRIKAIRDQFRSNPEIKWLPTFRNEHPQFTESQIRNVYYLYSTNAEITLALEKHFTKYSRNNSENGQ